MQGISAVDIEVAKPNVTTVITQLSDLSYQVTVSDVPSYITSVIMPAWTSNNDQDDIVWYNAVKTSDSSYSVTVLAKKHNFENGHYAVHIYGQSAVTNSLIGLAATSGFDIDASDAITNPTVTVQNYDAASGCLQVVVSETDTSRVVNSVRVAAWSQANQANIYWYTVSNISGDMTVITVDESYHHDLSGIYTVHTYVTTADGSVIGYNLGTYEFNKTTASATVTTEYLGTGYYAVTIANIHSNGEVFYAVWSDANGQDDIVWRSATISGTTATGLIDISVHTGTGNYHLHVYQRDNGSMYALATTEFAVNQTNYSTPYYNQRDSRWGYTYYGNYTLGATGCVPTSLAMIFSSLSGTTVLPTTVASYLYYNTDQYNKSFAGTSGQGIILASQAWGYRATALGTYNTLAATLQSGYHVVAAVQNNKFVSSGTHELVLRGYSNGMTYVYDPYTASNCGWYPVASLWNEQSTDGIDRAGIGAPFIKITDI